MLEHVEASNKRIIKFSASSWLILINKKGRLFVSCVGMEAVITLDSGYTAGLTDGSLKEKEIMEENMT